MFEKLGGRKVLIVILLIIIGAVIDVVAPNGLSSNLLTLIMTLGGGYLAGNVVTKFTPKSVIDKECVNHEESFKEFIEKDDDLPVVEDYTDSPGEGYITNGTTSPTNNEFEVNAKLDAIMQTSSVNSQCLKAIVDKINETK